MNPRNSNFHGIKLTDSFLIESYCGFKSPQKKILKNASNKPLLRKWRIF